MGKYLDLLDMAELPDVDPPFRILQDGVTVATARNRADAMQALGEAVQAVTTRPPGHTLTILLVDESGKRLRSCYLPLWEKVNTC